MRESWHSDDIKYVVAGLKDVLHNSPPQRGGVDARSKKTPRSNLSARRRGGQTGEIFRPVKVPQTDQYFRLRAIALALRARLRLSRSASAAARSINQKVASHLLIDAAATPPVPGGE